MLLIDPRQGSGDLAPLFANHDIPYGIMPASDPMEFADFMFAGCGPAGDVLIGIERKQPSELVGELRGGGKSERRLVGKQLPGLLENYEFPYLLVEGYWTTGRQGELVGWKERPVAHGMNSMLYREVCGFLDSLALRAVSSAGEPLRVQRTMNKEESVAWLVQLYKGWQKPWGQHHAHAGVYAPSQRNAGRKGSYRAPGIPEKMWCQVPGLDRAAQWVAQKYDDPFPQITVDGLAGVMVEVDGKDGKRRQRLGKVRAEKIVRLLRRGGP